MTQEYHCSDCRRLFPTQIGYTCKQSGIGIMWFNLKPVDVHICKYFRLNRSKKWKIINVKK
jgi:transposase-like protein